MVKGKNFMDFNLFCRTLRLNASEAECLYSGFESSERDFTANAVQKPLTAEYLDMVLPWIQLPVEDETALRRFAERVKTDPVAALLFFHAGRTLFEGKELKAICAWPDFTEYFGAEHQLFYLLLSCAVFAPALRSYRRAGLPEYPIRSIGRKILGSSWSNSQAFGVPGYDKGALYWLRHYVDLKVIPVGRFEFRHGRAETYGIEVYRRRSDRVLLALFGPAPCGFRRDGSACPLGDPEAVSSGALIKTETFVIGHALAPSTGSSMGVVKLALNEWEPIITASTPILEWHIPGGGGMTPEITRSSLADGLALFDRYFPSLPSPAAIMCSSWAFWHRYEELRPQANPALVMRECYEFDRPLRNYSGFYFIFGAKTPSDLPGAPRRDTSIRRTMLDILAERGYLSNGGLFILREDIAKWGKATYRNERCCRDWRRYLVTEA